MSISFGLGLMTRKEIKLCRVRLGKFESSTSAGQSARHSQVLGIVPQVVNSEILDPRKHLKNLEMGNWNVLFALFP